MIRSSWVYYGAIALMAAVMLETTAQKTPTAEIFEALYSSDRDAQLNALSELRERLSSDDGFEEVFAVSEHQLNRSESPFVRSMVAILLGRVGDVRDDRWAPRKSRVLNTLITRFRLEAHKGVRTSIVRALGKLKHVDSISFLKTLTTHEDPRIALEAFESLGRIGRELEDRALTPWFLSVLQDELTRMRGKGTSAEGIGSIEALGMVDDRRVLGILQQIVETSDPLRLYALPALERIAGEHRWPLWNREAERTRGPLSITESERQAAESMIRTLSFDEDPYIRERANAYLMTLETLDREHAELRAKLEASGNPTGR